MELEMTREEKEKLVQRVTDLAFGDTLNRKDMAAILEICIGACRRKMQELEKETGPACDIIQ